jgi:hypothetical protein
LTEIDARGLSRFKLLDDIQFWVDTRANIEKQLDPRSKLSLGWKKVNPADLRTKVRHFYGHDAIGTPRRKKSKKSPSRRSKSTGLKQFQLDLWTEMKQNLVLNTQSFLLDRQLPGGETNHFKVKLLKYKVR